MANPQTITLSNVNATGYSDSTSWTGGGDSCYISYNSGGPGAGGAITNCISFTVDTTIPAGSIIDSAYMRLWLTTTNAGDCRLSVAVQNIDPTSAVIWSTTNRPTGASLTTAVSQDATTRYYPPVEFGAGYQFGPSDHAVWVLDIGAAIQAIVDSYGAITSGEYLNLAYCSLATNWCQCQDGNDANPPQLIIAWTEVAGSTPTGRMMLRGLGSIGQGNGFGINRF